MSQSHHLKTAHPQTFAGLSEIGPGPLKMNPLLTILKNVSKNGIFSALTVLLHLYCVFQGRVCIMSKTKCGKYIQNIISYSLKGKQPIPLFQIFCLIRYYADREKSNGVANWTGEIKLEDGLCLGGGWESQQRLLPKAAPPEPWSPI